METAGPAHRPKMPGREGGRAGALDLESEGRREGDHTGSEQERRGGKNVNGE